MCTGLKGSQDSYKLHTQSTSFATRCAFFMGLNLLPRQGGWCHLRCPWTAGRLQLPLQMGTGLPQILCHPTQPEQTPEAAKDISNGRRQPCIDNWVSPHPSSHKSHAALSQSVSEGVPRLWGALLSRHPMKSGSYHLRKKPQHFGGTDGFLAFFP